MSEFKVHNHVAHKYKKRIVKKRGGDTGLYDSLKMIRRVGIHSAHKDLSEILRSDSNYKRRIHFDVGGGLMSSFIFGQTIQGLLFWQDVSIILGEV